MKSFRNIISILSVTVFLVPSAGFYYNIHRCSGAEKLHITIDPEYTCCVETAKIPGPDNHVEKSSCCSNHGNYLKSHEDYTSPIKPDLPRVDIHCALAFHAASLFKAAEITPEENSHPPPRIISSRALLLDHGVLLI